MKFLTHSEICSSEWINLLNKSSFSSPFQTPTYYNILKITADINAEVFALEIAGNLKALMVITIMKEPGIRSLFSRRGIIFGGPVLGDITNEESFFFFKQVQKELRGKVIYLETRNLFDYSRYKEIIQESGWFYQPHLNYQLALVGLTKDNLLTVFDNDVRRRIKNSISAGATYGICESGSEFELLYNILEHLYHEKVRLPLPSFDFFKNLYGSGILKVFVVKHQGNIIGGSFCPYDKNGIYTFYYCDKRYYNKRISPTHLSILSAMEFAIEQGIPNFDFMGAGKPGIPFGVRDFKKQFGGDLVENGRFINIINPLLYNLGKTGLKVLSKINL